MTHTIRIGTRRSKLALWQANHVADLLRAHIPDITTELVVFTTVGSKNLIGGNFVFKSPPGDGTAVR